MVLSDLVERLGLPSRDDSRTAPARRQQAPDDDVAEEKSKAGNRREAAFRYEDYGVPAAAYGYPPAVRSQ